MKIRELAKDPHAFFNEILDHDLSTINFIDSDFAIVNDETTEYYGFAPVKGRAFQRVAIPEKSERGRLIGVRDEAMIADVYQRIAKDDYSLRAAIHAVVTHESFGRK